MSFHEVPSDIPVKRLEISKAFSALTDTEAKYAHFFSKAAWTGAKATLHQSSDESVVIFDLLQNYFKATSTADGATFDAHASIKALSEAALAVVSAEEWRSLLAYAAAFYGNFGNYLGFGDSKIVPGIPTETFQKILESAPASEIQRQQISELWSKVKAKLYSLGPGETQLGFPPNGVSAYYSPGFTKEEAEMMSTWMVENDVSALNTRVRRIEKESPDSDPKVPEYEVWIASATVPREIFRFDAQGKRGKFVVWVRFGDYQAEMAGVVQNLIEAQKYAADETQKQMLEAYIQHFQGGKVEDHKESQRLWINDKGPVVETNIGFIESYRDPLGCRAEFEGLVAIVNKEMSAKFGTLVDAASDLIATLPWPKGFEKDTFLRPDFTSLEVLAFAGSGVPAGINIPNYDDIRQNLGFKNVSLGNVLAAPEVSTEAITFLAEKDQELYRKLKTPAFEVQVGTHELLGHGSGKLLQVDEAGVFNFDRDAVVNPLTGGPVTSWYLPGETWDGKFGAVSSAFEECRAECTGIFMSTNPEVLKIFGHSGDEAEQIMYINWLHMARAGLMGLEFFSPDSSSWRQAHMQARYAILRVLLAASEKDTSGGAPFLQVKDSRSEFKGKDSPDLEVHMEASKIRSVGLPAIADFLGKLNIYKATADVASGSAMFVGASSVDGIWLARRETVLSRKQPRAVYVQAHTTLPEGESRVKVVEFEASHEGLIQSFITRF